MRTFQNGLSTLCFLCVLFVIFTYGNDIDNEKLKYLEDGKVQKSKKMYRAGEAEKTECACPRCMTGKFCNESVELSDPKFNQLFKFVEITEQELRDGVPLQYNYTTYVHEKHCPCPAFEYTLTEVENENGEDRKDTFEIDKATGEIRLRKNQDQDKSYEFNGMYRMKVAVKNVKTNISDTTMLTVVLAQSTPADSLYAFDQNVQNGYDLNEPHSRHKRAVPTEVTFQLTHTNGPFTEVRVGQRVIHQLDITFPTGDTDIQVEIFAPDSTQNVMVLCDVSILSIGSGLSVPGIVTGSSNVVKGAKASYSNETHADWAIINLQTVTSSAGTEADSRITISYEAVMIEDDTVPSSTYWVSVGALYSNENFVWVGQSSFDVVNDQNYTVDGAPVFNVTMPDQMAIGSSHIIDVEMFLPYPVSDYIFKIFPPDGTVGLMSVCGIRLKGQGKNFECVNNMTATTTDLVNNPQGVGFIIGEVNLGRLLNKASRDNPVVDISENLIQIEALVHLYADTGINYVGQTLSLGLSLEIDTDTVLIGNADFSVLAEVTTGLTDPIHVGTPGSTLNLNLDDAVMFEPFEMTYVLQIPTPVTAEVASHYVLEMLAPMDGTIPKFSVCQFTVTYVGHALPCLHPEDLETVFSSRSGGSYYEPDTARIDLGHVTNLGLDPDNEIHVKAVLMPVNYSSNVIVGSGTHSVTFGVLVGDQSVTLATSAVQIGSERQFTQISNSTQPTFNVTFHDFDPNVDIGGTTMVKVQMITQPDITYEKINTEFLMPQLADNYAFFHICRIKISTVGQNIPCLSPDWYNEHFTYTSSFDNYIMDRASLSTGAVCNRQNVVSTTQDTAIFELFLKVLDRPGIGASETLSVGLSYSNIEMWVGNLQLNPQTGGTATLAGSAYILTSLVDGLSPTPIGLTHVYRTLIKIPRGDTADLFVSVVSNNQGSLDICSIRIIRAGDNLPCVSDEVATKNYDSLMSSFDLHAGFVKNYETSGEMTANSYFDDDSIELEYVIRANPNAAQGTYGFTTNVYFDSPRTSAVSNNFNNFDVTENMGGVSQTVGDPVTISTSVGEIAGGDANTDITFGEAKRILVSIVVPEGSLYRIRLKVLVPSAYVGKLELCDGAVHSVGDNLPCIRPGTKGIVRSTTNGPYNNEAEFDLGYTCSKPLRPGDVKANTVVFEVYARLVPNDLANIGDVVEVSSSVQLFSEAATLDFLNFTVTDPATFVDRPSTVPGVTNATLVAIDKQGTIVMGIAESLTIQANLTVPRNSVSRLLFDVELPVSDSACLTVSAVRVIGSVGANVLYVEGDVNNKNVVYSPRFESATNTSQMNYVFLDLGIVTNTGLSHALGTYVDGDDDVVIEFDIQMADCSINANGTIHQLSIGKKISDYVVIYDHDIQVFRDGNELVNFEHDLIVDGTSTSSVIYLRGTVYHASNSTAEGSNSSIFIFLPFYQVAPTTLYSGNKTDCGVVPEATKPYFLEIRCNAFYFTDIFEYMVEVTLDTSVSLPLGFSADPSYTFSMTGTYFTAWYPTYSADAWFPYFIDELMSVSYPLTVPSSSTGCSDSVNVENTGVVLDCQFEGSVEKLPSSPASNARYGAASMWTPFIRNGAWARHRYVGVYFGHLHKFTSILIKNDMTTRDRVTEIEVTYTNDGKSFFGEETVDLGSNPNQEETRSLSGVEARGVRITITNDTSYCIKPQVGMQFKLFGCQVTDASAVTNTDACTAIEGKPIPSDYYPRSFIGVAATSAYYCDRDIESRKPTGKCFYTDNGGSKWKKLDGRIGSLIGYVPSTGEIFAYNNDRTTLMMVDISTGKVETVTQSKLDTSKLLTDWLDAVAVPETDDILLTQVSPTPTYTMNNVGATYDGLFMSNVKVLTWT